MPMRIEQIKKQIEIVRKELGVQLEKTKDFQKCYDLNLKLDALIEEYIELTEI